MKKHVFFFDILRCVAAITVVVIHVLGPYRYEFGHIPFDDWASAVTINSFSRWAVPVFIMITGALMLSDKRPFDINYYLKRRLGKVLIPFVVWSLFYIFLSGWGPEGYSFATSLDVFINSYHHSAYYHLGFFYYFIPLYFVIPFFQLMVRNWDDQRIYVFTGVWLFTSLLFLFGIDGPWSSQLWLYSGYLLLGYIIYHKLPLTKPVVLLFIVAGSAGMISSAWMVITQSIAAGEYSTGRWLSYKTINTIAVASMVFVLGRYYGESLTQGGKQVVSFVSKHSLGIYLLHPLFLWPMRELKLYEGVDPLIAIPLWVFLSSSAALVVSWTLSLSRRTRWLLP